MKLRICGKATSTVWISISWAKSLSGLAIRLTPHFSDEQLNIPQIQDGSWQQSASTSVCRSDSCILHSRSRGKTEHLNSTEAQNGLTTYRFCGSGLLMLLCLWFVISHLLSPCSSHNGWPKIPFLISSDRAWPRLPQEGRMVAGWGLLRPKGFMVKRKRCHKHIQARMLTTIQHDTTWVPECCRLWSGDRKKETHSLKKPGALTYSSAGCGETAWGPHLIPHLLSNTDPFHTEVWPIYWHTKSRFLSSLMVSVRFRFIRPEKLFSSSVEL